MASLLTASLPNICETGSRITSQKTLIQSTLIASFTLLADEDIGQLYDMKITEDQHQNPQMITAKTTKKFKILIDWSKLLSSEPEAIMENMQEKPKPSSNTYVCINESNTWRIVARNRDENNEPLASIRLEIYHDTIQEVDHMHPLFTIPGPKMKS